MIVVCMGIQVLVVNVLLHGLKALEEKHLIKKSILFAWTLFIAVLIVMLTGNLVQTFFWAWMFFALGEFQDITTAFYHSLVIFTTLGYGDLVMTGKRQLLGTLEAANGVFMLGLTTSVLYSFVSALIHRRRSKKQQIAPPKGYRYAMTLKLWRCSQKTKRVRSRCSRLLINWLPVFRENYYR